MINKLIDSYAKYLQMKSKSKFNGELIFYIVYNPEQPSPNVYFNGLHPDYRDDEEMVELCERIAEKVREKHELGQN